MTTTNQRDNFTNDYLASWTEVDADKRKAIVESIWSPAGELSVSSTGEKIVGTEAIATHIDRVHNDLIAGKGLAFRYDQEITSGETLLLRWSMTTPSGDVLGRGVDTVNFTGDKQIETANMFMGVN